METARSAAWQRRRAAFNHDWLKNQYGSLLDTFLRIQCRQVDRCDNDLEDMRERLADWPRRTGELRVLIAEFEEAMSPAQLLDQAPLVNLDENVRSWLRASVHRMWLQRNDVVSKLGEVRCALEAADRDYAALQESIGLGLSDIKGEFRTFRAKCRELANTVSGLPQEIKVT